MKIFSNDNSNRQFIDINISSSSNIYSIIDSLSKLDYEKPEIIITLNINCGSFIKADCYLVIVCLVNELKESGKTVIINFNTEQNCDTIRYASRINFFSNLSITYTEPFRRYNTSDSLIEITNIKDSYGIDESLINLLKENFKLQEEDCRGLVLMFDELVCNITQHSKSINGGYFYCQKYSNINKIELIIVDSGIGIKESLNKRYPDYSNEEALNECLKFEVTNGNGRGHGLYIVSELMRRNRGEFLLISNNNCISISNGRQNLYKNEPWQGTIVKCTFNLLNPLPINEIEKELGYS